MTFEDSLQLYTVECINETAVSVSYEENRTAGEIELITLQYTCYNSTGNGEVCISIRLWLGLEESFFDQTLVQELRSLMMIPPNFIVFCIHT